MRERVRMTFTGQLNPASFAEFVHHRAGKLAVDAAVETASVDRCEVAVTGEPDLVDAFEMACSLGPIDCLVLDYQRSDVLFPTPAKKDPR